MMTKTITFLGIALCFSAAQAEVKYDGKTADNKNCVVRILDEVQTSKGSKTLVIVEDSGDGDFLNQASLMADMSGASAEGRHFRSIETVQRGSSVYNNLFLSEDKKSMRYTSDLLTKSSHSESILSCSTADQI